MSVSETVVSNYKITLSYDGQKYLGWQRHGDKPTIQHAVEHAMGQLFGRRITVNGSGRTDRGAHAHGQVASVVLPATLLPEEIVARVNDLLEKDIRIISAVPVADDFHACDSAIAKHYRYVMWNDSVIPADREGRVWHVKDYLDVEAMVDACSVFVGEHDFASFATRPNFKQKSTTRTIHKVMMSQDKQVITFDICANGFLYKMVRNIVRSIVKVGEGRYTREDLVRIIKAKDRKAAPGTAPASGLYLQQVFYAENELAEKKWEGSL